MAINVTTFEHRTEYTFPKLMKDNAGRIYLMTAFENGYYVGIKLTNDPPNNDPIGAWSHTWSIGMQDYHGEVTMVNSVKHLMPPDSTKNTTT